MFVFIRSTECNRHVRKGREGGAESLSHLLRWSFLKRYTLVAQLHRLNRLLRNLLCDVPFLEAEPPSPHFLAGVARTQPRPFFPSPTTM